MATKKYLSLERLTEYDELLKAKIAADDAATLESAKSYADGLVTGGHNHNDSYYTESEIDSKLSEINESISNITDGTTTVKEAEHAGSADEATHAISSDSATTAESATKATQDASGNVITTTYETKADATAKLDEAKAYTDEKVDGLASTTVVDNKISAHNTSDSAHSDIRNLVSELSTKVNNFLDVDDETTDQLSEVLELIANNKGTLDSITSNKVNVSDIVDNLTTASADKVLSANQGVVLKGLIDALQEVIDGKSEEGHNHAISEINGLQDALNESNNSIQELAEAIENAKTDASNKDAVILIEAQKAVGSVQSSLDAHTGDTTAHITSTERTNWGAAYTHSQENHAPINAQENVIESIKVNGTAQAITSKVVDITVPTNAADIGAAPATHGHAISEITDLQTTLNNAALAISTNTSSIDVHTSRIEDLEDKVGDGWEPISSEEIQNLFK